VCVCNIYRVLTVMENLEKSWNFNVVIFRAGKIKSQRIWKSHGNLLYSHVHLRWVEQILIQCVFLLVCVCVCVLV